MQAKQEVKKITVIVKGNTDWVKTEEIASFIKERYGCEVVGVEIGEECACERSW